MRSTGRDAGFCSALVYIGDREKTQEKERFVASVMGHVLLAGRNQDSIAGLEREFATVGEGRAFAGQDIDALFMVAMPMRDAERFARLCPENLTDPQRTARRTPLP